MDNIKQIVIILMIILQIVKNKTISIDLISTYLNELIDNQNNIKEENVIMKKQKKI